MRVYTDLHLHSCLSPCADDEMTPWNIVGMASLKKLDVIAITDHNSALNLRDAMEAGQHFGVQVLPGLEVTSKEEVHMLSYFESLENALEFGHVVGRHLPDIHNNPQLFGRQILMENGDQEAGEVDKLLISATDFGVETLAELIAKHGGIAVPAHINRGSNGILGALGLIPMLPMYPLAEVCPNLACPEYAVKGRFLLRSSDAHRLEDISERDFYVDAENKTAQAVWKALKEQWQIRQ